MAVSVESEQIPEWNPVVGLQLEFYAVLRLASEAKVGSS